MAKTRFTPGPWNLIWYGNEQYPYPLSILADEDGAWIARGGFVSSKANADLLDAAPDLYAALESITPKGSAVDDWWCPECQGAINCATNDERCPDCGTALADCQPSYEWQIKAQTALAKARGEA